MTDAEIRQYLRDNGYPEHVAAAGKQGLIDRWTAFVKEVERGYEYGLEDYRNDLDIRGIIEIVGMETDSAIQQADARFQAMLADTDVRVWESSAGNRFWDFGYPRNKPRELLRDLKAEGLIE